MHGDDENDKHSLEKLVHTLGGGSLRFLSVQPLTLVVSGKITQNPTEDTFVVVAGKKSTCSLWYPSSTVVADPALVSLPREQHHPNPEVGRLLA